MQEAGGFVDDDAELRETVSILLEREGFLHIQAADGEFGLQQALSLKPALVLVDLRLPRLSGIDLCKQLREQRVTTPIIILSAVRDEVDKVLLLEIGADDYVDTGKRSGLGLGLALSRQTMRDFGGDLSAIAPQNGRGACLCVQFSKIRYS